MKEMVRIRLAPSDIRNDVLHVGSPQVGVPKLRVLGRPRNARRQPHPAITPPQPIGSAPASIKINSKRIPFVAECGWMAAI